MRHWVVRSDGFRSRLATRARFIVGGDEFDDFETANRVAQMRSADKQGGVIVWEERRLENGGREGRARAWWVSGVLREQICYQVSSTIVRRFY